MPRKYRWPATRLDKDQMHELHCESVARGVPITAIIAEAVGVYLNDRLDGRLAEIAHQQPAAPAASSAA